MTKSRTLRFTEYLESSCSDIVVWPCGEEHMIVKYQEADIGLSHKVPYKLIEDSVVDPEFMAEVILEKLINQVKEQKNHGNR